MALIRESRRSVFRQIARLSSVDSITYESSPLLDRTSLPGVESDVRLVVEIWFQHDDHDGIDQFVQALPLAYVQFDAPDRYPRSTSYEMETLYRLFLLKECHGWDHETADVEYLAQLPNICARLDLESVPNQSTLWRNWHKRSTADLQDTVETAARTVSAKPRMRALRARAIQIDRPPDTVTRIQN